MRRFGEFVDSLAEVDPPSDQSVNIYRDAVRSTNLIHWLSGFDGTSQSAIFVGEAPGRDGGAITGIPFVSPKVLTSANDPWGEFGSETQYELPVGQDANHRERTATRFWKHVPPLFFGFAASVDVEYLSVLAVCGTAKEWQAKQSSADYGRD